MIYIEEQVTKGIMISKKMHQSDQGDEEAITTFTGDLMNNLLGGSYQETHSNQGEWRQEECKQHESAFKSQVFLWATLSPIIISINIICILFSQHVTLCLLFDHHKIANYRSYRDAFQTCTFSP